MIPKIKRVIEENGFLKTIYEQQVVIIFAHMVVIYDNGSESFRDSTKSFLTWFLKETGRISSLIRLVLSCFRHAFPLNAPLSYMTTFQKSVASPCGSFLGPCRTKTSPCSPFSILQNSNKYLDGMKTFQSIQAKCTGY